MRYEHMVPGNFLRRPNRFIAYVELDGEETVCHVKNTGRCRELLIPGTKVWCQHWDKPERKTKYDLITVEKGDRLINMDSQAPNAAAKEWLLAGGLGEISQLKPEQVWGDSRFDFSFQKDGRLCFLEVKGVTLEHDGICAFPDAPTVRGARHLQELTRLAEEGYGAYVLYVIQMDRVKYLHPNDATDPAFGNALRQAAAAGVQVMAVDCHVTPDSMRIAKAVAVHLSA
jgi:sugar fermentation stimulation protein A